MCRGRDQPLGSHPRAERTPDSAYELRLPVGHSRTRVGTKLVQKELALLFRCHWMHQDEMSHFRHPVYKDTDRIIRADSRGGNPVIKSVATDCRSLSGTLNGCNRPGGLVRLGFFARH